MPKPQLTAVILAICGVFILYFGCERSTPVGLNSKESSTASDASEPGILEQLPDSLQNQWKVLDSKLKSAKSVQEKVDGLKAISGFWYDVARPDISGFYAEEVAKLLLSEQKMEGWSIAATTYKAGLKELNDESLKLKCREAAVRCFDEALKLDPGNITNEVNKAMCFIDFPSSENPMQGVMLLRSLSDKYPNNVLVLNILGELAMKTGQLEKAIERLEKAISIDPKNVKTICLLSEVYQQYGETAKATLYKNKCSTIQ